jgi:hypothetical protein
MGGVMGCWALAIAIDGPVILKSIEDVESEREKLS